MGDGVVVSWGSCGILSSDNRPLNSSKSAFNLRALVDPSVTNPSLKTAQFRLSQFSCDGVPFGL